jgi:outer membrane protein assembly factor BamB
MFFYVYPFKNFLRETVLGVFFILGLAIPLAAAPGFPLVEKWQTPIGLTSFRTSIQVGAGIVAVGSNGNSTSSLRDDLDGVFLLDAATGKILRKVMTDPVGDRDVNGVALHAGTLFFGNDNDQFFGYALYGDGRFLWQFQTDGDVEGSPALEDLNSDGVLDVVFGTEGGTVYAVNGKSGTLLWKQSVPFKPSFTYPEFRGFMASPGLVDINKDGTRDVVIGSRNGSVYAFDGQSGTILWEFRTKAPSGVYASAFIGDTILVAETYSRLFELTLQGQVVREIMIQGKTRQGLFGSPVKLPSGAIVIGSSWPTGQSGLWFIPPGENLPSEHCFLPVGKVSATPVVADVMGDAGLEVLVVTEAGELIVLAESGDILSRQKLGYGVEATPYIGDIDGTGNPSLLIAGQDKTLHAYVLPKKGVVYWQGFRGNAWNTGQQGDRLMVYPNHYRSIVPSLEDAQAFAKRELIYRTEVYDATADLISDEGIGHVKLGTTYGKLKSFLGGRAVYHEGPFGVGQRGVSVSLDNEELCVILYPAWKEALKATDTITRIRTYNPRFKTKEGFGPGDSLAVGEKLFGKATLSFLEDTAEEHLRFGSGTSKITFGVRPVVGLYGSAARLKSKTTQKYEKNAQVEYVEIRR